jgi:hypothetical protein
MVSGKTAESLRQTVSPEERGYAGEKQPEMNQVRITGVSQSVAARYQWTLTSNMLSQTASPFGEYDYII